MPRCVAAALLAAGASANHPFRLPAAAKRPPPPPPALDRQSKDLLDRHNSYRAKHNVPNLTWDPKLAASARTLANECVYEISVLGQSIWQTDMPSVNTGTLAGDWYGEVGARWRRGRCRPTPPARRCTARMDLAAAAAAQCSWSAL
jgi:hypothetical protein